MKVVHREFLDSDGLAAVNVEVYQEEGYKFVDVTFELSAYRGWFDLGLDFYTEEGRQKALAKLDKLQAAINIAREALVSIELPADEEEAITE